MGKGLAKTLDPGEEDSIHSLESRGGDAVLGEILKRARKHHRLTLRQVQDRTGLPNAHLSQIERGVIRRPDPAIVMELADLYGLNYGLIAEWAGYVTPRTSGAGGGLLARALRLLADLDPGAQADVVRYLERLRDEREAGTHHA